MEYLISGGLLTLGYLFSKNNEETNNYNPEKIKENNKPNGNNIYSSIETQKIEKLMQQKANNIYKKAQENDSNIIMSGPPLKMLMNKVDYNQKIPLEFNSYQKFDNNDLNNIRENVNIQNTASGLSSTSSPILNNNKKPFVSLSGEIINENELKHNNMMPFFGGSIKQNVDEFSNTTLLENFSGNIDNYRKKQEIEPMFKPQTNVTNVYGMQNLDNDYDRYYVSDKKNNISPIEKIIVGPGLNQGYSSKPSGGFQQIDAIEYALPKTTDDIRVKTNPKVSYEGRIISGKHISKPGKVGAMQKKLPDRSYELGSDRWFTTTGNVTGNTQRPTIVMKYVNRKTTENKTRINPATPINGTKFQTRGKVKVSNKIQYKSTGPRNASAINTWNVDNKDGNHDYGKKNIQIKNNNRMITGTKTVVINRNQRDKKEAIRNKQQPRMTKKTNMIGNPRQSGNYSTPYSKGIAYDPNDIAKTTIKETNIHNNHSGNMNAPNKSIVYDPNDIAKTTIKETNIHNNHSGNMNAPNKSIVYDPNDIAKTTIKETNIHNNHSGNMNGPNKSIVYDPNDIAKTTIKETNIHNNHSGNIHGILKSKAYDPEDTPKITMKQTTQVNNILGQTNTQQNGNGYTIAKVKAQKTHRETTSTDYAGQPQQQAGDGYICANTNAPNTNRQFTSDYEYSGVAGPGNETKPLSYEDIYNATIKSVREEVSVGRTPGPQGDKEAIGADNINAYTKRNNETQNDYINERGVMNTKIYNSLPTIDKNEITQDKETLPNEPLNERLNDYVVEQFNKNPYTQSLKSYSS
jgi:hypothetical protein